jgi:hypothetical protein
MAFNNGVTRRVSIFPWESGGIRSRISQPHRVSRVATSGETRSSERPSVSDWLLCSLDMSWLSMSASRSLVLLNSTTTLSVPTTTRRTTVLTKPCTAAGEAVAHCSDRFMAADESFSVNAGESSGKPSVSKTSLVECSRLSHKRHRHLNFNAPPPHFVGISVSIQKMRSTADDCW